MIAALISSFIINLLKVFGIIFAITHCFLLIANHKETPIYTKEYRKDELITAILLGMPLVLLLTFNITVTSSFQFFCVSLLYIPFWVYVVKRRK